MTTWTINSRLGMTGTVVIEGTALRWNITAPPSSVGYFTYGASSFIPLVGDWNGDGIEGIGAYDPSNGAFHLKYNANAGNADVIVGFGNPGLTPISWHNGGISSNYDEIGIIDGTNVYLDTNLSGGFADINATLSDISCPSSGTVGQCIYTPPTITTWAISGKMAIRGTVVTEGSALRWNITAPPSSVGYFTYGTSSFIPLVGDWNGDGIEGIGVYDPSNGSFHLRQAASEGTADIIIGLGAPNLIPLSWYDESGSLGHDAIGIIDGGNVYLDSNLINETTDINATPSDMSCPSPGTIGQCAYTPPVHISRTVLGRIAITGTVVTEGTALRWNITAPPSSVGYFTYGASSFIPLVGDWKGTGVEGIGAYDPSAGRFHLKYDASAGDANLIFIYRTPHLTPISWRDESGSLGHDAIGVIDGSNVYLNKNINGGTEEIVITFSDISCPLSTIVEQCLYTPPTPPVSEAGGSGILIGALAIGALAMMMSKGKQ